MGVQSNDTCLIRLCHIREDNVDHGDQHSVLQWVTCIFDNRDNVCTVRSHVDEITAGSVRELNRKDCSGRSNNIGNVRNRGSRCGTKVEDLSTRLDEDLVHTTKNTSSKLTSERVPYTVFYFSGTRSTIFVCRACTLDTDALFAINGFTRAEVLGDQHIFLATGNENSFMAMGLLDEAR
ncbi:hypothetical protein ACMFMG_012213 [Clarireedia jacksonii]